MAGDNSPDTTHMTFATSKLGKSRQIDFAPGMEPVIWLGNRLVDVRRNGSEAFRQDSRRPSAPASPSSSSMSRAAASTSRTSTLDPPLAHERWGCMPPHGSVWIMAATPAVSSALRHIRLRSAAGMPTPTRSAPGLATNIAPSDARTLPSRHTQAETRQPFTVHITAPRKSPFP